MQCDFVYVYAVISVSLGQLHYPVYANFMEMLRFLPPPLPSICYILSVLFETILTATV